MKLTKTEAIGLITFIVVGWIYVFIANTFWNAFSNNFITYLLVIFIGILFIYLLKLFTHLNQKDKDKKNW